ncbi:MAG: tRNA (adenosine(37)-N6)-threonylcarbamoyltransferase complex ATPase subunit type 1 TsaE [Chloroflexota bacterium]
MPILDANTFEFFSRSPDQTRRIGVRLGGLLQIGDVICLQGNLGAGKTTLVQGIAQGWGALDPVSSPTFVLVNIYRKADLSALVHLDAYRLESAQEAEDLDLDHYLAEGPLVVEWPERIRAVLPDEYLWAFLEYDAEEHRAMRFTANGARFQGLLDAFQQVVTGVV